MTYAQITVMMFHHSTFRRNSQYATSEKSAFRGHRGIAYSPLDNDTFLQYISQVMCH